MISGALPFVDRDAEFVIIMVMLAFYCKVAVAIGVREAEQDIQRGVFCERKCGTY